MSIIIMKNVYALTHRKAFYRDTNCCLCQALQIGTEISEWIVRTEGYILYGIRATNKQAIRVSV